MDDYIFVVQILTVVICHKLHNGLELVAVDKMVAFCLGVSHEEGHLAFARIDLAQNHC